MKYVCITDDKSGTEPIDEMDGEIMIQIIPYVNPFKVAILVVSVHMMGNWLSKLRIEVLK